MLIKILIEDNERAARLFPSMTYANLTAETKFHLFAKKWFFGGNKAVRRLSKREVCGRYLVVQPVVIASIGCRLHLIPSHFTITVKLLNLANA